VEAVGSSDTSNGGSVDAKQVVKGLVQQIEVEHGNRFTYVVGKTCMRRRMILVASPNEVSIRLWMQHATRFDKGHIDSLNSHTLYPLIRSTPVGSALSLKRLTSADAHRGG
jgi:hypothetical protein